VIRAFDLKTQKEMKSLKDEKELGSNNKVTSLNVSEDGGFLVSGYKGGQVALWDLVNYKLIKIVPGLHTTDVVNARVYHMDEAETLYCLTAEESGRVQHIKFIKKSFLGGYSVEPQLLFKQRLKYTTSIVLQKT
jgi:WD40 repeat protein